MVSTCPERRSGPGATGSGRSTRTSCGVVVRGRATSGTSLRCSFRSTAHSGTCGARSTSTARCSTFWSGRAETRWPQGSSSADCSRACGTCPGWIVTDKLASYPAIWHVIRRPRGRVGDADTTYGQVTAAKRNITAAVALLDWLSTNELTLATAGQGDLDAWLASAHPLRSDSGNFVRWARRHRLTQLDHAADRWGGPTGVIDTETRWDQARWLLHDDTLTPATASPVCWCCSTPKPPRPSANSPSTTSRWATNRSGCGWAENRS